jgi:hypothetical protein
MKKLFAVLFVVIAVVVPLFAQSTVEKKDLSYFPSMENYVQLNGGIDFNWQTHNDVSKRGAGFRVGANYFFKHGFDLGLDASLMTMADSIPSKGPGIIRITHVFGYHFPLGHQTSLRVKAGAGVEIRLDNGKAEGVFTTEAGCSFNMRMTDHVALEFRGTCYVTLPEANENGVTFAVNPGFGLAFAF